MELLGAKLKQLEDKGGRNNHSQAKEGQNEIKVSTENVQFLSKEFRAQANGILGMDSAKSSQVEVRIGEIQTCSFGLIQSHLDYELDLPLHFWTNLYNELGQTFLFIVSQMKIKCLQAAR